MTSAEKAKEKRLRLVYNQSLEEHNAKRTEQKNACALCRRPFSQYQAYQDHDHDCCSRHRKDSLNRFCGKCNRGLLCFICNKKYVPAIEMMLRDGVDAAKIVQYVIGWQNEIKLKGGYAENSRAQRRSKKSNAKTSGSSKTPRGVSTVRATD